MFTDCDVAVHLDIQLDIHPERAAKAVNKDFDTLPRAAISGMVDPSPNIDSNSKLTSVVPCCRTGAWR